MATSGEKEIKTNWPFEEGLEQNQKHEGREINLVPEINLTTKDQREGLDL